MRALSSTVLAVVGVVTWAAAAHAGKARTATGAAAAPVAVTPFTGLHGDEPQAAVLHALGDRAALVRPADVAKTQPYVVVAGQVVKRDKGLVVEVTVTSVESKAQVGQLSVPVANGRHLSPEQLTELGRQVDELVTTALAPKDAPQVEAPPPPPPPPVKQAGDTEQAKLTGTLETSTPMTAQPPKRRLLPDLPRPDWYPYVEVSVGAIVDTRWLKYLGSNTTLPKYAPGTGGGVHADAALYPFAFTHGVLHGAFAGLGGFVDFDLPVWPTTQLGGGGPGYATSELRVEGGAKWKFLVRKWRPRLEIAALLGAGLHQFTIAHSDAVQGPPDVAYVYGLFGFQARANFWHERFTPWLSAAYEWVPDAGPVEDNSRYGLATTNGVMVRGGLDVRVWKRLRVGGQAFWERMMLDFDHSQQSQRLARRAIDQYYGGIFTVGYDY